MKRILIFCLYGDLAATNRHRFKQFKELFLEENILIDIKPLLDNNYLKKKFSKNKVSFVNVIYLYLIRLLTLFSQHKYDLIIIHCELFPFMPYFIEKLFIYKKYIYDFDDAIFLKYKKYRILYKYIYKSKFKKIISNSSLVFAGSKFLFKYAYKNNLKTRLLPTSVDTKRYINNDIKKNKIFTIGWIGSPSSEKYLQSLIEPFDELSDIISFKFVIVGANMKPSFKKCNSELLEWRYDNEVNIINTFDLGVMPLEDSDWERGKCAFKLIQYMACEIPVVASNVGFNKTLISNNVDGIFAKNKSEWINAIKLLYDDYDKRINMGKNGRNKIISLYDKKINFLKIIKYLKLEDLI